MSSELAKTTQSVGAPDPFAGTPAPHFVIVTGLSGAGKSQAAKCLEDLGYFCVDNLPPGLIPKFAELVAGSRNLQKVAIVLDIRGEEIFGDLFEQLRSLDRERLTYRVVFLDASDEVLLRRFSETRRKHPLAGRGRLIDSINAERDELKSVRDAAHLIIDTSNLTLAALKEKLSHAVEGLVRQDAISVSIVAFGYKYGIPLDADLIFDVRFLPNPNYVDELRPLTGAHPRVVDYLERAPEVRSYRAELHRFIDFMLPQFVREGKSHLTIGIGCTGGRHRSVYVADELAGHLRGQRIRAFVEYRDAHH